MQENAKFLSLIIPSGGRYVGFIKAGEGKGRNISANSADELYEKLMKENKQGHNVYFAPAAYGEGKGRKKTDVVSLRALWFDVDAHGDGKGYDTVEDAYQAAMEGAAALGLPKPLIVRTGRGIQAWYLFTKELDFQLWSRLASSLKKGLQAVGVRIDPTRTADEASIMRLPGSINHACGAEAVIDLSDSDVRRHDAEEFERILTKYGAAVHLVSNRTVKPKPTRYHKHNKSADLIVENCAQIRHFKETGSESEPHWFSSASILATCMDGEKLFHEWSSVYAGYNEEEAQGKITVALEKDAPHTCAQFEACNDLCEGCPHKGKIKGPAELGVLRPDKPQDIKTESGETISFADWVDIEHFRINKDLHLVQVIGAPDGEEQELPVCDLPIKFTGLAKDEDSNKKYIAVQQYNIGNAEWEHNIISARDLNGLNGLTELKTFGAVVFNSDGMRSYINASLAKLNRLPRMPDLYKSFGWKREGFLVGHTIYTQEGPKPAALQPESFADAKAVELRPGGGRRQGSLEAWKEAVLPFLQPGFEFQLDALVASFASVLMGMLNPTEGGVIRSYCSPKTGGGKTTASQLAQSVWGLERALQITATTSDITRANIWSGAGGLPTFEDESLRTDNELIRDRVTRFTMGLNTQRSSKNGKVQPDRDRRSSIHIVTSNSSILAALSQLQGSDAMQARVFETQVPPLPVKGSAKMLSRMIDNPGFAGPIFLQFVMSHYKQVKKALQAAQAYFADKFPEQEYRYKINYAACCSVAAGILNRLELVRFGIDTYTDWLEKEIKSEAEYSAPKTNEDMLRAFFDHARDKTLTVVHGTMGGRLSVSIVPGTLEPRGTLVMRHETSKERVVVSRKEFNNFMASMSEPPKAFLKWMEEQGHLQEMETVRDLTEGIAAYNKGRERVIIMSLKNWKLNNIQD